MEARLAALLLRIDPARTLEDAARAADAAVNSFHAPPGPLLRWEDFRRCVLRFFCHAEQKILGIGGAMPGSDDFHWGRCLGLLMKAFGGNGEKTAFELARTGVEGGVNHVLREMAQTLSEEYGATWVETQVWSYWNSLSTAEKLAAPDEYLREFGHLLPAELSEGSAGRIRANFPQYLMQHPRLLRGLRDGARRR